MIINGSGANDALTDPSADLNSTLNANWSAGDDAMFGGINNDTYNVNSAGDQVFENAGAGYDTIVTRLNTTTIAANVERLQLDNTPTQLVISPGGIISFIPSAVVGIGNNDANVIVGNDRDNTLNGLGGNDSLYGMNGNDTLDGGADDDYLNGGAGNDTMVGGSGNDTLFGDTGNDAMSGGIGNDIYYVDAVGDVVTEGAFLGGTDLVYSYISDTLDANVENMTLLNVAAALNGTGNASNNVITGNTFNNVLQGLAGNDTLNGMGGNDTLYGGDGTDTLDGGDGNDWLDGGAGNDTMQGGAGNDTMIGGAGNDAMTGGLGNDVYYIDAVGDVVTEGLLLGGTDTVYSYISDTLDANVENMTLLNTAAALTAVGNASSNVINGNVFNNTLSGLAGNDTLNGGAGNDNLFGGDGNDRLHGGAGLDFLSGNAGADTYVFRETGAANADTVLGFSHVDDRIELSSLLDGNAVAGITGLAFNGGNVAGNALSGAWYFEGVGSTGSGATNLSGIYVNTFDGNIWYNPTSAVANDSVLIGRVELAAAPTLDATDFVYGA